MSLTRLDLLTGKSLPGEENDPSESVPALIDPLL